jgi:hypothetical protein
MFKILKTLRNNARRYEKIIFLSVFAILIIFRVWLMAGIPKMYINAPYDDLYYAKMAHYLIHGRWMGPYSEMTLIKGPFYGFFMVFSFLTGLPLLLNETIFYVAACIVLFFAISPLIKNNWWRLLLFTLLLFVPASLATVWNLRVYREFVYFSLTLFVIAFSLGLFSRIDRRLSSVVFWASGLGISIGAFVLCREEGVWIYPAILLLLAICIIMIWIKKMEHRWLRSMFICSAIIIWYIPIFVVSYLNYSHYGFWGYSENLDNDFNRVINTIGRIKTSAHYPYNAITQESFTKAYQASPLLGELRNSIQAGWNSWQGASDQFQELTPDWYREKYLVGGPKSINSHVMFLLRSALADSGYYSNGRYPREYLRKLADQLEAGCANGALDCSPGINIPYVRSINSEQIPIILHIFSDNINNLVQFDLSPIYYLDIQNWPANQPEFNYFEEFVYNPIDPQSSSEMTINNQLVGGKIDLRLKILVIKVTIMREILLVYQKFTLTGFVLLSTGWLVYLFFSLLKRRGSYSFQALIVFLFVLALLISRTLTLALISANNGIDMAGYSISDYLFIYLVFFLMLFYLVDQITRLIFLNRKKDHKLISPKPGNAQEGEIAGQRHSIGE